MERQPEVKSKSEANATSASTFKPPLEPEVSLLMFANPGWFSLNQMPRVVSKDRHISISCAALSGQPLSSSPVSMVTYKAEVMDTRREHWCHVT